MLDQSVTPEIAMAYAIKATFQQKTKKEK